MDMLSAADQIGLVISLVSVTAYVGFIRSFSRALRTQPFVTRRRR